MINSTPLFSGEKIVLTAPMPDQDAEIEAEWSRDPAFLALIQTQPVRPLTSAQILRSNPYNEKSDKKFTFAIRLKDDQRLVGLIDLYGVMAWNGIGSIQIRIGKTADRGKGYGKEI